MPEQIIRPGAAASGRVTPASFPFYTTGEDNLRITSYNSAAGVSLKINGRLLDAGGRANSDSWDHTPNTDRSAKTTDLTLSGSTLLNLTVFASAGSPLVGQTFVKVQLIRGVGAGAIVLGTILQGYVTSNQAIGWPGSAIQSSTDGEPLVRTVTGTTPAAGVGFSESVPAGARWELISLYAALAVAAGGVNRAVYLVTALGAVSFGVFGFGLTITPGVNAQFVWGESAPLATDATNEVFQTGMPNRLILQSTAVFKSAVFNFAAADAFGPPQYQVREWLEVA